MILRLVDGYAPLWLAALLGAAVMAAVMASDSQILALSTMFTEDVFAFYQGTARFGQAMQVLTGRMFVVLVTAVAYLIALRIPQSIFDVATQYAFAGYAALVPLLVAALFWKNSTRWGALASTLWTAAAVAAVAVMPDADSGAAAGTDIVVWSLGDVADHHPRRGRHVRVRPAAGRADDADLGAADDCRVAGTNFASRAGDTRDNSARQSRPERLA